MEQIISPAEWLEDRFDRVQKYRKQGMGVGVRYALHQAWHEDNWGSDVSYTYGCTGNLYSIKDDLLPYSGMRDYYEEYINLE